MALVAIDLRLDYRFKAKCPFASRPSSNFMVNQSSDGNG
jgi:hypothetical protein